MAIAGPVTTAEYSSASTSTTSVFSPSTTIPTGSLVLMFVALNVSTAGTTAADNATVGGTANVYAALTATTASALQGVWIWSVLTRDIPSSSSWTVTGASCSRRNIYVTTWTGAHATAPVDLQATHLSISTSPGRTPTSGNSAALAGAGELGVYGTAWKGGAVLSGVSNSGANGWTLAATPAGSGGTVSRAEAQVSYKLGATAAGEFSQHSWTTVTAAAGALLFIIPAASGTAYASSVSGALSFTGSPTRPKVTVAMTRGALAQFSGARTASPSGRLVAGVFQPVGVLTPNQSIFRTLAAAIFQPVGGLAKSAARALPGSLSFTGVRTSVKSVGKSVTGALSFSGSQSRTTSHLLIASGRFAGVVTRTLSLVRGITGAFAPQGVVTKKTNRALTGAARFAGFVAATGRAPFTAILRPTGVVTNARAGRVVYAVLAPVGGLTKASGRLLFGALQASTLLNSSYIPTPPPTLPPSAGGGGEWVTFRDPFESWPYVGSRRRS